MSDEKNPNKIPENMTHAILALNPADGAILHFCGYFAKPKYIEFIRLHTELKNDPEFALQDKDFVLVLAEDEDLHTLVEHLKTVEDVEVRNDDGTEQL